jgi:hypothetical protein
VGEVKVGRASWEGNTLLIADFQLPIYFPSGSLFAERLQVPEIGNWQSVVGSDITAASSES